MKLYHGSSVKVKLPSLHYSERKHDFGKAFYLTSSYNQAMNWAQYKVRKNNYIGYPIVSIFNLSLSDINSLKIIRFEEPNKEWLEGIIVQ